jgi:8-oxo-dGTP pyrophosphatase MutT (NUDIX family)
MPRRERRDSARVIAIDPDGKVLLFEISDPLDEKPSVWLTPGGGMEPGEDPPAAAARELHEETGLEVEPNVLGSPIAKCQGDWEFRGRLLTGIDWFFALRTSVFEPDRAGWTDLENQLHRGWRWWRPEEIEHSDQLVVPARLAELVRELHDNWELPLEPIELPWVDF